MLIRPIDLKQRYRDELQLIEVPKKQDEENKFVLQYHIRGIGFKENEYVRVKDNSEEHRRMIRTLLEDEDWKGKKVRIANGNEFLKEVYNIPITDRWEEIQDLYERGTYKTEEGEEFTLYDIKTKSCDELSLLDSSAHLDLRFEMNDHLVGITLLDPGRTGDPAKLSNDKGMNGQKVLCETKARQPKDWLEITNSERGDKTDIEPGEIGATKWSEGRFILFETGTFEVGAIKPYYVEFFLYSNQITGRWNAVETGLEPLDSGQIPKEEVEEHISWLLWKPEEQAPYAVSDRAKEKKWIPENYDPIPKYWKEENPDKYKEWKEWVKGIENNEKREEMAKKDYKLKYIWWKGQEVIRKTREENFYLFIKDNEGIRGWKIDSNPIWDDNCSAIEIDVNKEDWKLVGEVKPNTKFNPNKELVAEAEDLVTGSLNMDKSEGEVEKYYLEIKEKDLKGEWILSRSDKSSDVWVFERTSEELSSPKYTVQRHKIGENIHFDISLQQEGKSLEEGFNKYALTKNPLDLEKGGACKVVKESVCKEPRWFTLDDTVIEPEDEPDWLQGGNPMKEVDAKVDLVGRGTYNPINWSNRFKSIEFKGDLEGYYVFKKEDDEHLFINSEKPQTSTELIKGDPQDQPIWRTSTDLENDLLTITIYTKRFFTSVLTKEEIERYDLPDLPEGINIYLAKYPKEGTTGIVKIHKVEFNLDDWDKEEALNLCRGEDLDKWEHEYIKE